MKIHFFRQKIYQRLAIVLFCTVKKIIIIMISSNEKIAPKIFHTEYGLTIKEVKQ